MDFGFFHGRVVGSYIKAESVVLFVGFFFQKYILKEFQLWQLFASSLNLADLLTRDLKLMTQIQSLRGFVSL